MPQVPNNWLKVLASWSEELLSTTGRIENLIGSHHQPPTGSYRESLFRSLLRRVLPERFRVSTGFIYRWTEKPSGQLDVLVWDAQEHSALLEEGELVILTLESVAAIVEVKSVFNRSELREALELLHPEWLVSWRHTAEYSKTGLPQQVERVPLRAVFAYTARNSDGNAIALRIFEELSEYYRRAFGDDAKAALSHPGGSGLGWANLVDAICVANCVEVEQTNLRIEGLQGRLYDGPGFAAFPASSRAGKLAVGRFCMYLLSHLGRWVGDDAAEMTLKVPWRTTKPGACCFGALSEKPARVMLWGNEVPPDRLWQPKAPLWT